MHNSDLATWKRILMEAYYPATCAARRWLVCRRAATGMAPLAVLIFHRIADDHANSWTTSTADFIKGLRWLKANCELISLAEVQERIRRGSHSGPAVSITFDDGYAENCDMALPLLIEEGIPCTYFVTTGHVLEGRPFEHDLRMGNRFAPNSIGQLRRLIEAGIDIGAHTRTHADLGRVRDGETLVDELITARDDLEEALGRQVRYFAFPYGLPHNLSVEAFHLARQSGYEGACSAYGGYNFPGDDPFHLQRRGLDGPVIRMKNWALFNPLHHAHVSRFEVPKPDCLPSLCEPVGAAP